MEIKSGLPQTEKNTSMSLNADLMNVSDDMNNGNSFNFKNS
jgi:hypothetical protein